MNEWLNMAQQKICETIDEDYDEVTKQMNADITDYLALRNICANLQDSLNFMICLCDTERSK